MLPPFVSEEEMARKRAERQAKKEAKAKAAAASATSLLANQESIPTGFKPRKWLTVNRSHKNNNVDGVEIRIITWNMLAQALVRRDLFPGSDFLKFKDRGPALNSELDWLAADIGCLQEVDKTKEYFSLLKNTSEYGHVYETGYASKSHGLMIYWNKKKCSIVDSKLIRLDDLEVSPGRRGISRRTRNIAMLVALEFTDEKSTSEGVIVATTHLFWHPRHCYERTRQAGLIFREIKQFRKSLDKLHWPCILAGDFNFQPNEGSYRIIAGAPLNEKQKEDIVKSTVVHETIGNENGIYGGAEGEEDEGGGNGEGSGQGEEGDPDKVITKCRSAREEDGLLTIEELERLFSKATSVYGKYYGHVEGDGKEGRSYYGERPCFKNLNGKNETVLDYGYHEPRFTNFTPLWRCTLDYIFLINEESEISHPKSLEINRILSMHEDSSLEPGLPRKGIEASDHIALGVDLLA